MSTHSDTKTEVWLITQPEKEDNSWLLLMFLGFQLNLQLFLFLTMTVLGRTGPPATPLPGPVGPCQEPGPYTHPLKCLKCQREPEQVSVVTIRKPSFKVLVSIPYHKEKHKENTKSANETK